jgi:hypothetical protein
LLLDAEARVAFAAGDLERVVATVDRCEALDEAAGGRLDALLRKLRERAR